MENVDRVKVLLLGRGDERGRERERYARDYAVVGGQVRFA